MADKLIKKTLIIAGIPSNKKVVKFKNATENDLEDKWYDVADKVQNLDLAKYGVVSGATVEVSFTDDEHRTVVYMKKVSGSTTEKEPEEKKQVDEQAKSSDVLTWTIGAVAKNKEVIKFDEDTEKWRKVSDEIKAMDYDAVGIKKGNQAMITLVGGVVTTLSIVAIEKKPENVKATTGSYGTNNIDNQSAVKSMTTIVIAMIEKDIIKDIDGAKIALQELTKTAKELIGE